jgi:hypothetical protein
MIVPGNTPPNQSDLRNYLRTKCLPSWPASFEVIGRYHFGPMQDQSAYCLSRNVNPPFDETFVPPLSR